MSGFIKLRRGLKGHWIDQDIVTLGLFTHLLLHANWTDQKILVDGVVEVVKRGELQTSERQISTALKANRGTIRRRLKLLESEGIIDQRRSGKFSIITISKYDNAEEGDPEAIRSVTGHHTRVDPPYKKTKNIKKNNKKEESAFALPPEADPGFVAAFEKWAQHRKELKKPLTNTAKESIIKKYLLEPDLFRAAVEHSIRNGWQGLFEPKNTPIRNGHSAADRTMQAAQEYMKQRGLVQ